MALASLPVIGACGGVERVQTAAIDMATIECPKSNNPCFWFAFVDGGQPSAETQFWDADGGAAACPGCNFGTIGDNWCGSCQVTQTVCGVATVCSLLECSLSCDISGRRPAGMIMEDVAPAQLGEWLARTAQLEAASVPAFAQLALELALHGAPERLIARARKALRDEERHASIMGELARAAGARLLPLDVKAIAARPLDEIALENAVEGCVRETAGALLAQRQAESAREPRLKQALTRIARDEAEHAALAWDVDAWLMPRLTPLDRRRVEAARLDAARQLLATRAPSLFSLA